MKGIQLKYLLTALLFGTLLPCFAQSVSYSIDRKDILIGEPIHYRLLFTFPSNDYKVDFNVPDSLPHFEVMNKKKFDSADKVNYFVVQDLTLTSWDSGSWQIPAFPVKIRQQSNGGVFPLSTDPVAINVNYAPADSTGQLRDIKPVMDVFYIDRSWIWIAAAVLAGLILLFFIIRYFVKRPKKVKSENLLNPYDEAMQSLAALKDTETDTQEKAKLFFTNLGEIFKRYYNRRRAFDLSHFTTTEILNTLRRSTIDVDVIEFVTEALQTGDAAKFAKYLPPAYETDKCLQFVQSAIMRLEKMNK